ncbi:diacylglycerol/lipid kinase family protein [Demequina aestuarii]|uniref:diacylglycerol/lipid kinase family protein n=1 Tax=Demequina aestuarii TaxID=327095 RepID=UPI00078319E1|nr:diacylglycerol kinase family protein [Demequina aestuarii]
MSAAHVGIILNPSKTSKADLEKAMASAIAEHPDATVSWFETTVEDPGRGMAKDALEAGVDLVIAAGGDGTVRAVAEYLAEVKSSADLGIIPMGTGNLLARNLEVPLNDIEKAMEAALNSQARTIDLGWADITTADGTEKLAFTVMAGVGIDAHMIIETAEGLKDKVGWLAYIESLGRALSASDVIDMDITVDQGKVSKEQAHTLIVGNCGMLQGGVTLLPDADPADGELDMLVLRADGVAGWLETFKTMIWDNGIKRLFGRKGKASSSDSVTNRQFSEATLGLGKPRVLELDGDEVGECTRVEFSIQAEAIRVRSPQA